jgi:hypothetical protein
MRSRNDAVRSRWDIYIKATLLSVVLCSVHSLRYVQEPGSSNSRGERDKLFVSKSNDVLLGTIQRDCNPLTLAIIGHSKSGTTALFDLILEHSGVFSKMFNVPEVKEVGCLSGFLTAEQCLEKVRGPATCVQHGELYSNLTIDASPQSMQMDLKATGLEALHILRPATVVLLRKPSTVITSLYNHWSSYKEGESCDMCPLSTILECQLTFLAKQNRLDSIMYVVRRLRRGDISVSNVQRFRDSLVDEYRSTPCDGCRVQPGHEFIYQHLYLLDSMYELELLSHRRLMVRDSFLVIDAETLQKYPNDVRDILFMMLLGNDVFSSTISNVAIPSWTNFSSNVKSSKKQCALLSKTLLCKVARFMAPFDVGLFKTLKLLTLEGSLVTIAKTKGHWWDSDC